MMKKIVAVLVFCLVTSFSHSTFASGVSSVSNYNPSAVVITGGTINNTSIGSVTPGTGKFTTLDATTSIGATTPGTGKFTTLNATTSLQNNNVPFAFPTAPTISGTCWGNVPNGQGISLANGTLSFRLTVGDGASGTTCLLNMPTASNGWFCKMTVFSVTVNDLLRSFIQTTNTVSSVNFAVYMNSTGSVDVPALNEQFWVNCLAF